MSKQIEALKLALEGLEKWHFDKDPRSAADYIAAIREALAEQPAQQQEPVATVTSESGNPNVSMSWWHEPALPVGTLLYTSPPASKPLTDEEIMEMYNEPRSDAEMLEFARAIEAAHSITGEQK